MEQINERLITKKEVIAVRNKIKANISVMKLNMNLSKQEKKEAKEYSQNLYNELITEFDEYIDEDGKLTRKEREPDSLCVEIGNIAKYNSQAPIHLQLENLKHLLFILSGAADPEDLLTKAIVLNYV